MNNGCPKFDALAGFAINPPRPCGSQGELFGYILDLTGGVTGSVTCFIFPALAYLRATDGMTIHESSDEQTATYRSASKALVVFGGVVMLLVPVAVALSACGY